jgi:hypothetical protein
MVDLKAVVLAPPGFITTNPSYEWAVPGTPLYSYSPIDANDSVGKIVYLADDNGANTGTSDQEVKFAWVSGGTLGVSLMIKNVNGQTYLASTTFNVEIPSASDSVKTVGPPTISVDWLGDLWASAEQGLTNPAITITASVQNPANLPSGGQWTFLQLITDSYDYWYTGSPSASTRYGLTFNGREQLDTNFPATPILNQGGVLVANPYLTPGSGPFTFIDNPGIQLTGASLISDLGNKPAYRASFADVFQTYVMYKPIGANSIWVPLLVIGWSVGAAADDLIGAWQITSFSSIQSFQSPDSPFEPQWNYIIGVNDPIIKTKEQG